NQEYPFEYLVEKIVVKRDAGRNPLFDVMFAFQDLENNKNNMPQQPGSIEGQNLEPTPRNEEESERIRTAKFDLTLVAIHSNDRLSFIFEYCTKLFKTSTIRRFISYFKQIFSLIIQSPGVQLGQLEILSTDEKKQILLDFNRQEIEYPINKSIPQLFHEQVVRTPHSIAFVGFVGQALLSFNFITYDQLNQKVLQTAAIFNQKNISPGSLIGLMAERSLEMIIGMLGILYAGCGYVPLNPKAPASRADYMLSECGANLLLITHSLFNEGNKISTWKGEQIIIESIMEQANPFLLHHSSIIDHHSNHFSNLAYVIFTSGSTGKPKGVPITHANLSPLLHWGYHHLELGPKDRALQNLAYYFDWSVWEIFITLTSGASLWALPDEILLDPEKCVFFINRHGITVLHATPTQFRHLARINREIKSLTYLFIGAEKLTFDLVRHSFDLVNPDCRVFNMYGPTEATIIASVLEIDHVHFKRFESQLSIPIGRGVGNGPLFVLDRYFKLCPINITGELYIGGDGVAAGYLNNPELTAEKFRLQVTLITQTNKSEKNKSFAGGQGTVFYKTGDLVRWLPNGYIEFFGRIDQQIKIRGQRIELGEIENQLVKHVDVKEAVVIAKEKDKEEFYLCAYFVPHRQKDRDDILPTTLKEFLGFGLPSYMIPAYFIPIEKIPLTANGKIDLGALPGVEIRLEDNYAAPTNEIERILVRLWAEVLNITNPLEISIDDDFFELGGHSLKATVLTSRIHKELDVHLPLAELFTTPTIRGLAEYIKSAVENVYESIMPVEEKEYYALSFAQKRMYILQQIELNSTAYNMTQITPLPEEVDVNKLGESFKKLIRRHDSLRTSFHMIGDQPVQKIHKEVAFEIERIPVCSQFIRSFDLSQAPLLRVKLIKTTEGKQYLLVDMHHIISDGISSRVLTEDFMAFYEGKELPSLRIQYKDFAQWQNSPKEVARLNRQMLHWLKEFAGEIPSLEIPMDYLRPAIQDFEGDSIHFEISAEETKTLKTTALHGGATLFMILTAAVNILLSKLSGQEEIIIGIPIAGRRHPDLEKIIGMFVNTLVLRSHPLGDRSFQDFLENVKEKTLMAFENQEYPFEDLVDKLSLKRDMGRNPLFDVMFVMQNINSVSTNQDDTSQSVTGQPIQPGVPKEFKNIAQTAKFDLTFFAAEIGLKAVFTLQYCTKIFKKESIERFIHYFKRIVGMVATEPGIKISEIEIISEDEKKRILYDFNGTG
ncbi:MAG TPA: amino acid adenylation domain-containing protein, partial [Candidatus Kapabacteria bacterium]|nr:amino acid adenylation domain-containing protein [Candidatus Kapabacteria bacterium]